MIFKIIMLILPTICHAEEVIIKYKKYEKIDLGSLEIKGKVIAPGDLTSRQAERKIFSQDLYDRESFKDLIKKDITNLR